MADIIKVENETITSAVYVPASESGPWTVNFSYQAPSQVLYDWLMDSGLPVNVEVTRDGGTPSSGTARVITGDDFLLVGRTDMTPVV